jgi:hypothetical protein
MKREAWAIGGAVRIYRQKRRQKDGHKLVTNEKRQALQPAASH